MTTIKLSLNQADDLMFWSHEIVRHSNRNVKLLAILDLLAKSYGYTAQDVLDVYANEFRMTAPDLRIINEKNN